MDADKIKPIHEALAKEIAGEAVDAYAHLLSEDEREFIQLVLETDLLFDPQYANAVQLAAIDTAVPTSSGVQEPAASRGPVATKTSKG